MTEDIHPIAPARVRILHLEDNKSDAELIVSILEEEGLETVVRRVESREEFGKALEEGGFDLILSDFSLPAYDGLSALNLAMEHRPEIPFIFISGTIGEEKAVKALLDGATDYLLKSHLSRLAPAVLRALREAEQRQQQKRLHEALLQSEAKYRQIVEATDEGIWQLDSEGRTVFVNTRLATLLDRSESEILRRRPLDFIAPVDREPAAKRFSLEGRGRREVYEIRFERKDGVELWTMVASTPLMKGDCCVGELMMVTDITEKKRLESQFLQAQKMEAVGRLAGGVAHDFNNLLTVILANCEFVLDSMGTGSPAYADVLEIDEAAKRAVVLTRQLLTFSRKQVYEIKPLDPNETIRNMESLLRKLIGEDIVFDIELDENVERIQADSGHLEQVIMNLAVNARDAMPMGGRLAIRTESVKIHERSERTHPEGKVGSFVVVTVSDTGVGMDAETLSHAFEPFFTTKEVGKGTGLGLSTVYEIVHRVSGSIEVDTALGMGTSFRIWFSSHPPNGDEVLRDRRVGEALNGGETLLVVEDEEILLRLVSRVLARFGCRVLSTTRAEAALEILKETVPPVDLVITDVVLPGLSGLDLGKEFEKIRPGTKVLYISGYTDAILAERGILPEGIHFMNKPFTPEQLLEKIREVLESR